jgi:5'-AMP-activated protein kinase catalytic alpha subunit
LVRTVALTLWIGKTKGKGTFGKVKQGTHQPTGEKVAIKILEKEKIKDHADLERINREITILKKVRHSNVVQLYEVNLTFMISFVDD